MRHLRVPTAMTQGFRITPGRCVLVCTATIMGTSEPGTLGTTTAPTPSLHTAVQADG